MKTTKKANVPKKHKNKKASVKRKHVEEAFSEPRKVKSKPAYTVHCVISGKKIAKATGKQLAERLALECGAREFIVMAGGYKERFFVHPNLMAVTSNTIVHITLSDEPPVQRAGFKTTHIELGDPVPEVKTNRKDLERVAKVFTKRLKGIDPQEIVAAAAINSIFNGPTTPHPFPFTVTPVDHAPLSLLATAFSAMEEVPDDDPEEVKLAAVAQELAGNNHKVGSAVNPSFHPFNSQEELLKATEPKTVS